MPIMPRFPGYNNMPFQYYSPYRRTNFYNNYRPITPVHNSANQASNFSSSSQKESFANSEKGNFSNNNSTSNTNSSSEKISRSSKSNGDVLFELFGIKLYFDDVLILSLLFFLYKEEVKDEGLFLALILLLIS